MTNLADRNHEMFTSYTGLSGGPSYVDLAEQYGMSRTNARRIIIQEEWAYIKMVRRYHVRLDCANTWKSGR